MKSFERLGTYCRELASDLPDKGVEPIALAAGTAQQFLGDHVWDQDAVLARLQRRIIERHLTLSAVEGPAPSEPPAADGVRTVRLAKTEVGFGQFEGRSWVGQLRHMILCQVVLLFVAEQTDRLLGGETAGGDDGTDGADVERHLPAVARPPSRHAGRAARGRGDPLPPATKRRRETVAARGGREARVSL